MNTSPDFEFERLVNQTTALVLTAVRHQWMPGRQKVDPALFVSWMKKNAGMIDPALAPWAFRRLISDGLFETVGEDVAPTPVGKRKLHLI